MGACGDEQQIPFDFAQGRLSWLAALARRNDKSNEQLPISHQAIRQRPSALSCQPM